MKLWVFDLDGTIVDSFGQFISFFEGKLNRPLSKEEKKIVVGTPPRETFKTYFGEVDGAVAWEELKQDGARRIHEIRMYDRMEETISHLKNRNLMVAIWTARNMESTRLILEKTGMEKYVDKLVTSDCVSSQKPNPEGLHLIKDYFEVPSEEVVMIGDHDHDMTGAQSAGVTGVRAHWHGHWEPIHCTKAQFQFDCSIQFSDWVRTRVG